MGFSFRQDLVVALISVQVCLFRDILVAFSCVTKLSDKLLGFISFARSSMFSLQQLTLGAQLQQLSHSAVSRRGFPKYRAKFCTCWPLSAFRKDLGLPSRSERARALRFESQPYANAANGVHEEPSHRVPRCLFCLRNTW